LKTASKSSLRKKFEIRGEKEQKRGRDPMKMKTYRAPRRILEKRKMMNLGILY
jgi:hypothetical protein